MNIKQIYYKLDDFFLTQKEKLELFENLAELLVSKIDISTSLNILLKNNSASNKVRLIKTIQQEINNGGELTTVVRRKRILPHYLIPILQIGEQSGQLPENINLITLQIKKNNELKGKLRSASLYPSIVFFILIAVFLLLSVSVIPQLSSLYRSFKGDLPVTTQIVVNFGSFMEENGSVFVTSVSLLIFLLYFFLFVYKKTKFLGHNLMLRIPVLKNIIISTEISRFALLTSNLIEKGFAINESFQIVKDSTALIPYKTTYNKIYDSLTKGFTFEQIFADKKNKFMNVLIPSYVRQVLITNENSGHVEDGLSNIHSIYSVKSDKFAKDFASILEPVLIIVIWIGVSFIAISVITPIYGLTSNIRNLSNQTNVSN